MKKSTVYLITVPGAAGSAPQQFVSDSLKEMILFIKESQLTHYFVQSITKIDYSNADINEKSCDKV